MALIHSFIVALIALAFEVAVGYPSALFRLIGHPVTWMGRLIAGLDRRLNSETANFAARRSAGVMALIILLAVTVAVASIIEGAAAIVGGLPAIVALAVIGSSLLAARSLDSHVAAVARALRSGGLEAGRQAVSAIVGRNPAYLDEPGVARAAIESLAESFSDGVTAPLLWFAVLGLPGAAAYKAINTADSMIGHKSERHHAFGWAAARLDDLVNLPASRLTAWAIVLAALSDERTSAAGALRAIKRDAGKHKSPNAGWPEAAMAGALGLRLNGPKMYGEERIDDAWMGDGRPLAHAGDIERALKLYRNAVLLIWLVLAVLALALFIVIY
jgi:adenosylcobinamide-phosphate synthase